jgi:hypothetical protein
MRFADEGRSDPRAADLAFELDRAALESLIDSLDIDDPESDGRFDSLIRFSRTKSASMPNAPEGLGIHSAMISRPVGTASLSPLGA